MVKLWKKQASRNNIYIPDWVFGHGFRITGDEGDDRSWLKPGVKKNDVQLVVQDGHILQISGEYKKLEGKGPVTWYSFERPVGKFFRQFELPENSIRVEDISAHQENGVLTVSVPKKSPAKAVIKKVPIRSKL